MVTVTANDQSGFLGTLRGCCKRKVSVRKSEVTEYDGAQSSPFLRFITHLLSPFFFFVEMTAGFENIKKEIGSIV